MKSDSSIIHAKPLGSKYIARFRDEFTFALFAGVENAKVKLIGRANHGRRRIRFRALGSNSIPQRETTGQELPKGKPLRTAEGLSHLRNMLASRCLS